MLKIGTFIGWWDFYVSIEIVVFEGSSSQLRELSIAACAFWLGGFLVTNVWDQSMFSLVNVSCCNYFPLIVFGSINLSIKDLIIVY